MLEVCGFFLLVYGLKMLEVQMLEINVPLASDIDLKMLEVQMLEINVRHQWLLGIWSQNVRNPNVRNQC